MRVQSWFAGRRAFLVFRLALLAAVSAAAPTVRAAYWTVPVNYYELETIRYPLAITGTVNTLPNLGRRGSVENAAVLRSGRLVGETDYYRGLVGDFNVSDAPELVYSYPTGGQQERQASLSLWIKLKNLDDQVIAARGDSDTGFTLQTTGSKLAFLYWDNRLQREMLTSLAPLAMNVWYNVVITQSSSSAPQGAYGAMYLNDVLQQFSDGDIRSGGLLSSTASSGVIGSASTSGYVYEDGDFKFYQREGSNRDPIFEAEPFASAFLGEFRLFYGTVLVCSDKTGEDPLSANVHLAAGSRCVVTSDISSISQDRIEQASYRARLPFRLGIEDHNFGGRNSVNKPECKTCPLFEPDNLLLRQHVARFSGDQRVSYPPSTSPLSLHNLRAPYSVAMWVQLLVPWEGNQTLYSLGKHHGGYPPPPYLLDDSHYGGFHIYLSKGRIYATVWGDEDCTQARWAEGVGPTPRGWHHIAVSYDAPRTGDSEEEPNGLQIFVDGTMVGSAHVMAGAAPVEVPATIGQTGVGGACDKNNGSPFSYRRPLCQLELPVLITEWV